MRLIMIEYDTYSLLALCKALLPLLGHNFCGLQHHSPSYTVRCIATETEDITCDIYDINTK